MTGVTRPACWPDTLPVGGLVVAPESSAYCSCGLAYQMSFALALAETGKLPIKKEYSRSGWQTPLYKRQVRSIT